MVKRRVFKKSLGKRRQARQKAQVVTTMVRYTQPKASAFYGQTKVEVNVPIWIYGTLGGDTYSLLNNSDTWHQYLISPSVTWSSYPEFRNMMNNYMYYKVNGCSLGYVKTYGSSAVNEIRQAPPLAFNVGPALSTSQTNNLTKAKVFDMDDSYRVQPLSEEKDIGTKYYKFKNMRSGFSTQVAGLGEWENTAYVPSVLFSLGAKENPENAADASIRIGAVIVTIYISFKKPVQANNYS